jgi:cyclopropane-fatty-acyl-phospholipid synthase
VRTLIELADQGLLPDRLIRLGIRHLDKKRLRAENHGDNEARRKALERFIADMRLSPIAIQPHKANEQHYEMPPAFFRHVLGRRLKYSGCYWPARVANLDQAEAAMLALTCRRADLSDSQRILELGCGWGSLSLWMAQNYPGSRIVAVSNSRLQREYIESESAERNLKNLQVITADMNDFSTDRLFDRVVSVEMFEHMRNWPRLLERIAGWLKPDGKLFVHIFAHRQFAYAFEAAGDDNWMGRHFFSGGMMPSDDLLLHLQDHLAVEKHWQVDGSHYNRTAEAWLSNMDKHRKDIMPIMASVYGDQDAGRWFQRWRIFFMACAELWGYRGGREWIVSHYRMRKKGEL